MNRDIVITIPATIKWDEYKLELDKAAKGEILNYKVSNFPKTDRGNRCYICYKGHVIGYHIIHDLVSHEFTCSTTGKEWKGKFVQRTGTFNEIEPIPMKGFMGFRYFEH